MDSQELFDSIMDSAVLLDKAGRIINWNSGAANLFGYTKREVIGKSVNLIYDRNYPFPKLIQEINGQQKRWQQETNYIRKNGLKGTCRSQLCSLPANEHNKITAILLHQNTTSYKKITHELVTAKNGILTQLEQSLAGFWGANTLLMETLNSLEQTERRLRESELRFHLLAENATDVISRHAPDGRFLYVSPACRSALEYESEELIGTNFLKLLHHDDQHKIKKTLSKRHVGNKVITYRIRKQLGEFRWFESNVRFIIDNQTRIISEIQLASRDITDRILDKKARLRGQQLAHVFRLSTMEEMASGMAHEISQPLAAIVNYTRGCVRHLENEDYDLDQLRNIMTKATNQAERAGEIIHRLKNFFCKGQLVKTPCKINNVIRETISLMKNELSVSKTKIDLEISKETPSIFIDKIQIQQVVLNLIQNAIEAMNESHSKEKRIHIDCTSNNENIEITLSDTGPGFSKDLIHKVFMPFFTTKAHGRGMGLAICRSIIEAHGGEFTINPNSSGKSWIRFSLPISI